MPSKLQVTGRKLLQTLHPLSIFWAVVLGGVSGASATGVRLVFRGLQWCFTRSQGTLPAAAAALAPWARIVVPLAGASVATLILAARRRRAARLGRAPRRFVDYVEAIRGGDRRIPLVPNLWRTGSSAFSIATGAAIGREGSMIQFAAAVTSNAEQIVCRRWPEMDRFPAPLAIACGVAGGVATSYQAPVAAVFFAMEIGLGALRLENFLPVGFASAAGWLVSRSILRPGPLYPIGAGHPISLHSAALIAVVALLMGCLGPVYQKSVRGFAALGKLPLALLWAAGLVGVISLWEPRVWGNGDEGLNLALGLPSLGQFHPPIKMLAVLIVLRVFATAISTGVGTVGGVFTPTLFAGAALTACLARSLPLSDPVLLAIAGMGCLIAAATHAPLMATFMAVELTGEWRMLPVLLLGNLISWQVAKRISPAALYAIATDEPKKSHMPREDGSESQKRRG